MMVVENSDALFSGRQQSHMYVYLVERYSITDYDTKTYCTCWHTSLFAVVILAASNGLRQSFLWYPQSLSLIIISIGRTFLA